MTDNIEKILFLKSMENGKRMIEACIFYKNQTLKYLSYEEGVHLLKQLLEKEANAVKDLYSYDKVEILSKNEFEDKYKYQLENRMNSIKYKEYVKGLKEKEKKTKKKKRKKSSILDKISFIRKPINKALLIGSVALVGVIGIKAYQSISEILSSTQKTTVKNLEINDSLLSEKVNYTIIKDKEVEQPLKITINKGIEEEIVETELEKRIKVINYYSKVYNLNEEKVVKIIKKTTNILSKKSLNKKISNNQLEFKILNIIKNIHESIYTYQKEYGKIKEYNYEKKHTYREMVRHYAKLYGIDANKALAIEFHESWYLTADIATVKHNPGAKRRSDGEYYTYPNMEQGIIEHMITLCNYKGQSIQEMAARYLGSKKRAPGWAKKVQSNYNRLENNPNYYTLSDEQDLDKNQIKIKSFI